MNELKYPGAYYIDRTSRMPVLYATSTLDESHPDVVAFVGYMHHIEEMIERLKGYDFVECADRQTCLDILGIPNNKKKRKISF